MDSKIICGPLREPHASLLASAEALKEAFQILENITRQLLNRFANVSTTTI
jgi:hypothetical protein